LLSALRVRPPRRRGDYHLLDALLHSLSIPIVACAADSRLTHANPAAKELIGRDCVGAYPHTWIALLRPRMPSGITMPLDDLPPLRALRGEVVRDVDVLVRIRDRDALLAVAARPAIDRRGRPRGAVVLLQDVTDRRRREAALRAKPPSSRRPPQ
jgi:PAS domain-containing protein